MGSEHATSHQKRIEKAALCLRVKAACATKRSLTDDLIEVDTVGFVLAHLKEQNVCLIMWDRLRDNKSDNRCSSHPIAGLLVISRGLSD
jgi:hypothetical protein